MKIVFTKDEAMEILKRAAFERGGGQIVVTEVSVQSWSTDEYLHIQCKEERVEVTGFHLDDPTPVPAPGSTDSAQTAVEETVKEDLPL